MVNFNNLELTLHKYVSQLASRHTFTTNIMAIGIHFGLKLYLNLYL